MAAGDVNRRDGLADIVVGIEDRAAASILVFEGPDGALAREPEPIELRAGRITDIELRDLDRDFGVDIVPPDLILYRVYTDFNRQAISRVLSLKKRG